jgi:bifunctional non-homologous end joining protein LigD
MPASKKSPFGSIYKQFKQHFNSSTPFPSRVDPMLATAVKEPFDNASFLFELKWDGYRIIAYKNKTVSLRSREFQDYTNIYSSITSTLKSLPFSVILDGEVIMLDDKGKPSFEMLQQVKTLGTDRLVFCVFDILWLEGYSLLKVPLIDRKKILSSIIKNSEGNVAVYPHIINDGLEMFRNAIDKQLEGIVAKQIHSTYHPGERSKLWMKIQAKINQEFVIGGWSESESGRPFRSLLFGYHDKDGRLIYFGHSGGGYTSKNADVIKNKLLKLKSTKNPFYNKVETSTPVHWVKPILVGVFEYATVTKTGKIRKPAIFKGFRTDKKAKDVILEKPLDILPQAKSTSKNAAIVNQDSNWPELIKSLEEGSQNKLEINDKTLEINNIEKILWSKDQITKSDLIRYYIEISEYILPYLKNRPLSLHIKHKGIHATGMYIKGMEGNQPGWTETFVIERKHKKAGKSQKIDYLLCQDTAALVYIINLGCIDINPWNSTIKNPHQPDYLVIDLDPTGGPFEQVVETAIWTKRILDKLGLIALVKTSGKTGLHILIPVLPQFTYPEARFLTLKICELIHKQIPEITTLENEISKREKKVFLDNNQNDEADTIASVYSVRPYHLPNVSTPLNWKEVNQKLDPSNFNIASTLKRIQKKGDMFKNIFSKKITTANTKQLKMIFQKIN